MTPIAKNIIRRWYT